MIDTEKAQKLVNEINKYKEYKEELLKRSTDKTFVLDGICAKNLTSYGYIVRITFKDKVTLDRLNKFIEETIEWYNERIKYLTEELSNL